MVNSVRADNIFGAVADDFSVLVIAIGCCASNNSLALLFFIQRRLVAKFQSFGADGHPDFVRLGLFFQNNFKFKGVRFLICFRFVKMGFQLVFKELYFIA